MVPYDEFSMFADNAAEFGIDYRGPPQVDRVAAQFEDGRKLSGLKWGLDSPELVFLHGGAQNAHTWDTVALAIDRPMLCLDLAGHGHSDAPANGSKDLARNSQDVAVAIEALAPNAGALVGMSLGGLTTLALVAHAPQLVRRIVLVDITPGVDGRKAAAISAFVNGPESFPNFDDLLARTMEYNPTRSESSLRRGILHNAEQRPDGSWVWRYARHRSAETNNDAPATDLAALWDVVEQVEVPIMLVRGLRKGSVVDDADEAELLRRCPSARVEHVTDAGHSIQGDAPVELARLIADFA